MNVDVEALCELPSCFRKIDGKTCTGKLFRTVRTFWANTPTALIQSPFSCYVCDACGTLFSDTYDNNAIRHAMRLCDPARYDYYLVWDAHAVTAIVVMDVAIMTNTYTLTHRTINVARERCGLWHKWVHGKPSLGELFWEAIYGNG